MYYSNGNIMYDGDWINNKREGNGKYIFENGEYYIGQYKNGLRNGKGTMYYSNGNIKYEGDWINKIHFFINFLFFFIHLFFNIFIQIN